MAEVISVKFRTAPKSYYFDPKNEIFHIGENVIVETIRGIEFGEVTMGNREVADSEIVQPLKPIQRKANEKDIQRNIENLESRKWLIQKAEEKVAECKLQMKISDAEYTFDRKKTIVYYTADGRVDFRELVRRLAGAIGGRIEMRQIYEREDIKMKGALGTCGIPCCCTTFLNEYAKSSIKMAKNQGLALNPSSVNGYCGKPMCCLRYEDEFYQEANKRMPKFKSRVMTPDGEGVVSGCDVIKEKITVRFFNDGIFTHKSYAREEISFPGKIQSPEPKKSNISPCPCNCNENIEEDLDDLSKEAPTNSEETEFADKPEMEDNEIEESEDSLETESEE